MMFALSSTCFCLLHHVILSLLHNVMLKFLLRTIRLQCVLDKFFSCFVFDKWPPICILHNLFTKWDIEKYWLVNVTKTLKCCACRRLVDKVATRGYIVIIFNFSPWRPTRFNGGPKLIGWTHNMGKKALVYKQKLFRILISSHTLRLLIFKWINVKASHVFTIKIQDVVFFFIMEGFVWYIGWINNRYKKGCGRATSQRQIIYQPLWILLSRYMLNLEIGLVMLLRPTLEFPWNFNTFVLEKDFHWSSWLIDF
jgi:hypothetical protein